MRLAEATKEHLGLVALLLAVVILIFLWPKITRRIEEWTRR